MKLTFDDLRVFACVSCGRVDLPLVKLPGMADNLRSCGPCLAKHGLQNLGTDADRMLSIATHAKRVEACLHCGEPVICQPNGMRAMWCAACERERLALATT